MKIETSEDYTLIIKEVYSGVCLETQEGNRLGICMRDDTFEFSVIPKGSDVYKSFRVNMQTLTVETMGSDKPKSIDVECCDPA